MGGIRQNLLKWGGSFFSNSEENLKDIYSELVDHDYEVVEVHQNEDCKWVLQVCKTEVLAADKLYRRCVSFNELAESFDSYFDGWDVTQNV